MPAVCPMSQICGMLKKQAKLIDRFSLIVPPLAARDLSRPLMWRAPGDERENIKQGCTISLGRLQYIVYPRHIENAYIGDAKP
jgi:hypothetical protein